jgi:malate dehydrogenase
MRCGCEESPTCLPFKVATIKSVIILFKKMSTKSPVRVLISGAAGQIGYALIPLVATGQVFGTDQPVILHLVDIEPMKQVLQGVVMEIDDGAYPLVHGVIATSNYEEGFKGIHYAFLVGGFPRKAGMERKDLLEKNRPIFVAAGEALEKYADRNVKVLVVANPANTNCLVALKHAPSIPRTNFTAMTRLDSNRAQNQIAARVGVPSVRVKNVLIWGNHSVTQVPDATFASVDIEGKESVSAPAAVNDDAWLSGEFQTTVQKRGAAVIAARGLSSAMSAANAAKDHMRDWVQGTAPGQYVSMSVITDGNPYGVAEDIIYSFPCTTRNGEWTIVRDLAVTDRVKELMKKTETELLEEKSEALGA